MKMGNQKTVTNAEVRTVLNKGIRKQSSLTTDELGILNYGLGGDFTVKSEVLTELGTKVRPYKSMKQFVGIVPVIEPTGYYSKEDDTNITEMTDLGALNSVPAITIPTSEEKLKGVAWEIKKYAAVTKMTNEFLKDTSTEPASAFMQLHSKKSVTTENKVIFAAIQNGITPDVVTEKQFTDSLDSDLDASLESEIIVVTNQDGLKKLKGFAGYRVLETSNGPKRFIDIYPIEIFSNNVLPNVATGIPLFYGSFKESVKFFDYETLQIRISEVDGFESDESYIRGIEKYDVQRFGTPDYEYKVLSLV